MIILNRDARIKCLLAFFFYIAAESSEEHHPHLVATLVNLVQVDLVCAFRAQRIDAVRVIDEHRQEITQLEGKGARHAGINFFWISMIYNFTPREEIRQHRSLTEIVEASAKTDDFILLRHVEKMETRLDARIPEWYGKSNTHVGCHVKVMEELSDRISRHEGVITNDRTDILSVVPVNALAVSYPAIDLKVDVMLEFIVCAHIAVEPVRAMDGIFVQNTLHFGGGWKPNAVESFLEP